MHDRRAAGRNCDDWRYQKQPDQCYTPYYPKTNVCPPQFQESQLPNFVAQCAPLRQNLTANRATSQLTEIPAPCPPGKPPRSSRTNVKNYPNKVPFYLVPVVYVPEKIIVKDSVLMQTQHQRAPLRNQTQIPCQIPYPSRSRVSREMNTRENQRLYPPTYGRSRERVMNECQTPRPRTCPSVSRGRNPFYPARSRESVSNAYQNSKPCPSRTRPAHGVNMNTYQNSKQCPRTCPSWQITSRASKSRESRSSKSGILCNVKSLSNISSIMISQVDGSNSIVFKRSMNGSSKKSLTSSSHISLGNLVLSCSRSFPSRNSSQRSIRRCKKPCSTKATCLSAESLRAYDKEKSRELLGKSHSTLTATCLCPKNKGSNKDLKEIKSILTAKRVKGTNFDSEELLIKSNDKSCKDLKVTITTEYVGTKVRKPEGSRSREKLGRKKGGKDTAIEDFKEKNTSALIRFECANLDGKKVKSPRKLSKDRKKKNDKSSTSTSTEAKKNLSDTPEIKSEDVELNHRSQKKEKSTKNNGSKKKENADKSKSEKKANGGNKNKTSKTSKETSTPQNKNIRDQVQQYDENYDYDSKLTQTKPKKTKTEHVDTNNGKQAERRSPLEKFVLRNGVAQNYYEGVKPKLKCFCSPAKKSRFKNRKEPPVYLTQAYY